jgi:hypothetical protein
MPHECKRCGYECDMQYILKRHLQRKKPCQPLVSDISTEKLLIEIENLENESKNFKCKFCDKTFTASSNMYRHQKTCKNNISITEDTKISEIEILKATVSDICKKLDDLNNTKVQPQIITNNIDNTVNNNIYVLNNFGNESYQHITDEFLKNCIMNSMSGVKTLIEKIHFSEDAPLNKNVRIRSLKNNLVEVADNKKWVVKDANEAMETMINKGCRLLNGFYYNPETKIMELDINELDMRIQSFLLTVMDKNNKNYFAVRRRILALIIENTDGM